jgi:hypothetical protein
MSALPFSIDIKGWITPTARKDLPLGRKCVIFEMVRRVIQSFYAGSMRGDALIGLFYFAVLNRGVVLSSFLTTSQHTWWTKSCSPVQPVSSVQVNVDFDARVHAPHWLSSFKSALTLSVSISIM